MVFVAYPGRERVALELGVLGVVKFDLFDPGESVPCSCKNDGKRGQRNTGTTRRTWACLGR